MVLPPSWQGIAAWTGYAASISGNKYGNNRYSCWY